MRTHQIDLEDAIAAKRMTVAEYAENSAEPAWRVRRAIADGFLKVNRKVRPLVIEGGEMPLTVQDWQRAIEPATKRIRKSVSSFSNGGKTFNLLCVDGSVRCWTITQTKYSADIQRREIDAAACKRIEAEAAQ